MNCDLKTFHVPIAFFDYTIKKYFTNNIYYMYNIIQLNDKDLSELQSIAKELGITKTESLKKEESGRASNSRSNQKSSSGQSK